MRLDPGQIEVLDDQMAEICRNMTGAQRLAIADDQVNHEAARRLSHGAV